MKFRCGCVWLDVHCPNEATAEDGLCDWCAPHGARTEDELRQNPNALIAPDGTFLGLGGAGMGHDAPLARLHNSTPSACWYKDSGRTIAPPTPLGDPEWLDAAVEVEG